MSSRYPPMTPQMEGALQFLAARGEMTVRAENRFVFDEVSRRTAWALERRGYAERHWAGGKEATIYITGAGREAADKLLPLDEEEDDDFVITPWPRVLVASFVEGQEYRAPGPGGDDHWVITLEYEGEIVRAEVQA